VRGAAGEAPEGASPHEPASSGDPIERWAHELADVIARRPAVFDAALADVLVQDVLYEAMADLDEWEHDLTDERTRMRLAGPRAADAVT
jgi:hypothetical protein